MFTTARSYNSKGTVVEHRQPLRLFFGKVGVVGKVVVRRKSGYIMIKQGSVYEILIESSSKKQIGGCFDYCDFWWKVNI
jgi:hypothetical protein